MDKYILRDKTPIKYINLMGWAIWFERADRRVALTEKGDVTVSTVFLGIDYSSDGKKPLLFETMIFGGEHDQDQWRYSTWEEADEGHAKAVEIAFGGQQ